MARHEAACWAERLEELALLYSLVISCTRLEAEGRRLLYVALTRARKVLMIFTLAKAGDKSKPSRFLHGLFPGDAAKP